MLLMPEVIHVWCATYRITQNKTSFSMFAFTLVNNCIDYFRNPARANFMILKKLKKTY